MPIPLETACWICRQRPVATPPVCDVCDSLLKPCHEAWRVMSAYLLAHWPEITRRGSFDLTKAFIGNAQTQAANAHLYFVKLLGDELAGQRIDVDLTSFSRALLAGKPHAEVTVLVADCSAPAGRLVSYSPEVSVLKSGSEVQSALWTYLLHPVAVKICYLKAAAPLREPDGFPWHPTRQRKLVKLSPYKGDTQPLVARRDLRI